MSRHNYQHLRGRVRASREQAEGVRQLKKAMLDGEKPAQLREQRKGTQQQFVAERAYSRSRISQIESGNDVYLSMLSRYVETLGGHLEIAAVFPDERVDLTPGRSE